MRDKTSEMTRGDCKGGYKPNSRRAWADPVELVGADVCFWFLCFLYSRAVPDEAERLLGFKDRN